MKAEDKRQTHLPKSRTGRHIEWLAARPIWMIGTLGMILYFLLVGVCSTVELCLSGQGSTWVKAADSSKVDWWDVVYFNFTSILTIGYGDYSPNGPGARFLTICETLSGAAVLGITLAAVTAKFMSAPQNAIVFSRYAYYCTEDEKFLVIFLNTTYSRLVNAEISSFFKLGGDWSVHPSVMSPFVTRAVQSFFTDHVPKEDLVKWLNESSDTLRFGITGKLGAAAFSAAVQYDTSEILVISNRRALSSYKGFWVPNLRSREFQEMFHYRPSDSPSLLEFVKSQRQISAERISKDERNEYKPEGED